MKINIKSADKIKIINGDDIFSIMQKILLRDNKIDRTKEHFWVAGLAVNNMLLFVELVTLGTKSRTAIDPPEVFRVAVLKNAASVILIHNHPSENLEPSEEDKEITDRFMVVGKIIEVPVIDHLIISENKYLSFAEIGLLKVLENNSKFTPLYMVRDEIRQQISDTVKKEEKSEIARKMKEKGYKIEEIAEVTGLSPSEIRALTRKKKNTAPDT